MKLIDNATEDFIQLPNDLLWVDEFEWSPVTQQVTYSLSGALLMDTEVMQAGRPISLEYPSSDMAWVRRSVVSKLYEWAETPDRLMTLQFEYPEDTRSFTVRFRFEDTVLEAEPVREFPEHYDAAWFRVKINLIEVA